MDETLNIYSLFVNYILSIQVRSTVNTNQIKSIILLQNTNCVQEMESLPMRNACIIFIILYIFVSKTTKTRH